MRAGTGAGIVAVAAAGAAAALGSAATRRWHAAEDPTGGAPLSLPDGEDDVVITADGARLRVRVSGDPAGPVVVLVHCWTGDRRVWGAVARKLVEGGPGQRAERAQVRGLIEGGPGQRAERAQVRGLIERGHRVVLYDHRGHGGSTLGDEDTTLETLAADLRAVLDHVDARGAVVAGHSMGGMTAQVYAVEHPDHLAERVQSLVIVSSGCDELGRGGWHTRLANATIDLPMTDRVLAIGALAPFLVRRTVGTRACMAHMEAVVETLLATPPRVRRSCLTSMQALDLGDRLRDLDVPVSVVVGAQDLLTPPARSRRICELVGDAILRVVPDAGHMLPIEAPDEVAAIIAAAVRRSPTTA